MSLKQRTELKRGASLRSTKEMSRGTGFKPSSTKLARTEMNRGTGFKQGGGQLARTGPIKAKAPKGGRQRVEITVFAGPALVLGVELEQAGGPVAKVAPKRRNGMKSRGPKMTAIRQSAKDEECTLRFPCCNHRTDTTVLCHRNGAGAGMKAADTDAAYGCYACHVVLDGQAPRPEGFTRDMMLARFEVAVELTRKRLVLKGLVAAVVGTLEVGGVEKQKPTPVTSRDRLQLKVTDRSSTMSTKIVPQINSVVSAHAREKVSFSTFCTSMEVQQ